MTSYVCVCIYIWSLQSSSQDYDLAFTWNCRFRHSQINSHNISAVWEARPSYWLKSCSGQLCMYVYAYIFEKFLKKICRSESILNSGSHHSCLKLTYISINGVRSKLLTLWKGHLWIHDLWHFLCYVNIWISLPYYEGCILYFGIWQP